MGQHSPSQVPQGAQVTPQGTPQQGTLPAQGPSGRTGKNYIYKNIFEIQKKAQRR